MIQAERTPNPQSLKFTAADGQFADGVVAISSQKEISRHPLGQPLFALDGVVDVFITPEFVTVSKDPAVEWSNLKADVEDTLADYLDGQ
ncbi:MAG: scaffolding protein [Bacteroidetes bacterium SW_9_63_38]|nr:MAG: scaffolding protein [Bacteroidetes bacterium SW_9_63_38]